MKKYLLSICILVFCLNSFAQQLSENGYVLPPKGTVRVLLVYAQIDFSVGNCPAFPVVNGQQLTVMSNDDWPDGPSGTDPYWETHG